VQREFGLRLERQFVGLAVDFRQHHRARTGRQLGQSARDGGQGGVVADQQVPVELGRHDERAARAAHAEHVAGLGLLSPLRGGAGVVQREVDLQRAGLGVVAARRVVAHGGAAAGGPHGAVGPGGRQRELAGGGVGKEDLRVVVEAGAVKPARSGPVSVMRTRCGVTRSAVFTVSWRKRRSWRTRRGVRSGVWWKQVKY
jgi:hypothetical protein